MDQAKTLAKALLKNSNNPTLAWQLFKRSVPTPSSSDHFRQSIPLITRMLLRAKMFTEIDTLHRILLSQPFETYHQSLLTVVHILAKSGHLDKAVSQFQSFRTQYPDKPPSIGLYNSLIESSLRGNSAVYISWLYEDLIFAGRCSRNLLLQSFD
ncbi:unnamed protein product, partial [Ilex paraguariensis]